MNVLIFCDGYLWWFCWVVYCDFFLRCWSCFVGVGGGFDVLLYNLLDECGNFLILLWCSWDELVVLLCVLGLL